MTDWSWDEGDSHITDVRFVDGEVCALTKFQLGAVMNLDTDEKVPALALQFMTKDGMKINVTSMVDKETMLDFVVQVTLGLGINVEKLKAAME